MAPRSYGTIPETAVLLDSVGTAEEASGTAARAASALRYQREQLFGAQGAAVETARVAEGAAEVLANIKRRRLAKRVCLSSVAASLGLANFLVLWRLFSHSGHLLRR